MERVQIISGNNGVYFDSKGRRLVTMGDCTPRVGEWVYTNGKTIYGHMTGGTVPPVINPLPKPVIPFLCYSYALNYTKAVVHLHNDGKSENFVVFNWYDKPLQAFVSDKRNAYGAIYGSNDLAWYNLLTGESLGEFNPVDACVADNGDLLTIEVTNSSYNNDIAGYDDYICSGCIAFLSDEYDDEMKVKIEKVISAPYCSKKKNKDLNNNSQSGAIKIRRNGKVIKTIELDPYRDTIGNMVAMQAARIHNSGGSSGKMREYIINNDGTEVPAPRQRPPTGIHNKSASASYLKIYPSGAYTGIITATATARAFPVISFEANKNKTSISNKDTPVETVNDFFEVSCSCTQVHGIGINEGLFNTISSVGASGAFFCGSTAKLGNEAPTQAKNFNPIPGYDIKGIKATVPMAYGIDSTASFDRWVIIDTTDIKYSGLAGWPDNRTEKKVTKYINDQKVYCENSWGNKVINKPLCKTYDIRNGFKVELKYNLDYEPMSLQSAAILDSNNKRIVEFSQNSKFYAYNFVYYWDKLAVGILDQDNETYFVIISNGYSSPLIVQKGNVTEWHEGQPQTNYSVIEFWNRAKLKKAIEALCSKPNPYPYWNNKGR